MVSTHSHPKVAVHPCLSRFPPVYVSTHSHPKVAIRVDVDNRNTAVSTHSHPKVAAHSKSQTEGAHCGFNTQSPEGGWCMRVYNNLRLRRFNTQSPEGGWPCVFRLMPCCKCFNTQSPEGGCQCNHFQQHEEQKFQHTAARRRLQVLDGPPPLGIVVSTHSRPKAAALLHKRITYPK